jgi:hypothetical protein
VTFALNPDTGPPRVIRFVLPGTLPGRATLSLYNKHTNLLIIDREKFEALTPTSQQILVRTHLARHETNRDRALSGSASLCLLLLCHRRASIMWMGAAA